MKFLRPDWLWALLLIPVLYWLLAQDIARRKALFGRFADSRIWSVIAPEIDWGARLRKGRYWLAAMGCLVLALARPQWGSREEVVQVTGLDVMVVLDVSNSMEVEDVVPSRLKKAKHVIRSLVSRLGGDRVAVIGFAASATVASPLTTDLDYALERMDALNPRSVGNQGTDIGVALETASRALERGAEEASGTSGEGKSSRVVILVSDGEDHQEQALQGAAKLRDSGARLYVLGVGTQKGGPIPIRDESGQLNGYKKDRSGGSIVSTFRSDALLQISAAAKGRNWNVTAGEGEVEEMLEDMGALNRTGRLERRYQVFEERFQIPLGLAALLILIELSLAGRAIRRRGSGAAAATLLLALTSPVTAQALPLDAYLENEKGVKAYKEGKIEDAKKSFGSAQAHDPQNPLLQFNQGVVQLRNGEIDAGMQALGSALDGALRQGNQKLAADSLFNMGAAYEKKGDIEGALKSYLGAIEASRAGKDSKLEQDSRKNIELLYRRQQEQKQKEQAQQEGKDGEPDPSKSQDSKDSKDKKDSQEQKNKDQSKQYSETPKRDRKQEFKSEKMSKEDAERVMAELQSRERELQEKVGKNKPQARGNDVKDW